MGRGDLYYGLVRSIPCEDKSGGGFPFIYYRISLVTRSVSLFFTFPAS
jgi:hypothetical protein